MVKIMQTDKSDTILPMLAGTSKGKGKEIRITPKLQVQGKRHVDIKEAVPVIPRPPNQRGAHPSFLDQLAEREKRLGPNGPFVSPIRAMKKGERSYGRMLAMVEDVKAA